MSPIPSAPRKSPMRRPLPSAAVLALALWAGAAPAAGPDPAAAELQPAAGSFVTTPGPLSPDGVRATVDLPAKLHIRNTGGSDSPRGPGYGSGLCVPTSVEHAARWQGITALDGFQGWAKQRPGGSYPEKLAHDIEAFCREKGVPVPDYVQHTGGDERFLDLVFKTGRLPGATYSGMDGFYKDRAGRDIRVAHMLNPAHLDATRAAVIDNNRPGEWVWMSRADYLSRWRDMGGGWAVAFLPPPPPPYGITPPRYNPAFQVGQPAPAAARPAGAFRWEGPFDSTEWGPWHKLTRDGRTVGAIEKGGWHPCVNPDGKGDTFATAPAGDPPVPGPEAKPAAAGQTNYGVDMSKLHAGRRYYRRGVEASVGEVFGALEFVDDADKWNLTVVNPGEDYGSTDFSAKVLKALSALPPGVRAKFHVQHYAPDHWAVTQFGLRAGITIRRPAVARVGADAGLLTPADFALNSPGAPDRLGAFVDAALSGRPYPPAPAPAPKPGPTDPDPDAPDGPACWLLVFALPFLAYYLLRRLR